jgi:hypothetical protein
MILKQYLKLLEGRKQAKLQWLLDPSQMNGGNVENKDMNAVEILGPK